MAISLSDVFNIARRWQESQATVTGSVFTDSQELQIKFTGRVTVYNDGIVITSERGCELAITLLPEMTITHGDVLEIRHSGYRCLIHEPKD